MARLVINVLDAATGEGSEFAGRPSLPTPRRWRSEPVIGRRVFLVTLPLPFEKDMQEEPSPPAAKDLMVVLIAKGRQLRNRASFQSSSNSLRLKTLLFFDSIPFLQVEKDQHLAGP